LTFLQQRNKRRPQNSFPSLKCEEEKCSLILINVTPTSGPGWLLHHPAKFIPQGAQGSSEAAYLKDTRQEWLLLGKIQDFE
jgi:hypothetical protein